MCDDTDCHFEDLNPGDMFDLGSRRVTESELIEFGAKFTPLPFHCDPVAAKNSIFGGIIASGAHTISLFMSMAARGFLGPFRTQGSPGIDAIRFPTPLRPADTLRASVEIVTTRVSRGDPTRGVVRWRGVGRNQRDERVLDFTAVSLFPRASHGG